MTLTASEVGALTIAIRRWEYAEYTFAALVAIACFGEYIADFTKWWNRGRFWKWFGSLEHRKDNVAKFSTLVLIAALAGELVCVVKTNRLSGLEIANLQQQTENIRNDNLSLQSEILRLRTAMADRSLTLNQHERDSLAKFPGQRFEVLTYAADREARKLSDLVAGALQSSRWIHEGTALNSPDGTSPLIIGVRVELSKVAGSETETAASALSAILGSEHLSEGSATRVVFPQDVNGRDPRVIRITVGSKPPSQ
jgi:hypothetical protein